MAAMMPAQHNSSKGQLPFRNSLDRLALIVTIRQVLPAEESK